MSLFSADNAKKKRDWDIPCFNYIKTRDAFRQQKSAKKGSEMYLMFGPNYILVTLRWYDRHSPGQKNVCRWFLNRYQ